MFEKTSHKINNIVCPDSLFSSFYLVELTQVMRQKNDQSFAELLCRVRAGNTTPSGIAVLQSRSSASTSSEPSFTIHTCTANDKVKKHNISILKYNYESKDLLCTIH